MAVSPACFGHVIGHIHGQPLPKKPNLLIYMVDGAGDGNKIHSALLRQKTTSYKLHRSKNKQKLVGWIRGVHCIPHSMHAIQSNRLLAVMTDIFSPEKRSEVMRLVRSKGNRSTELRLIAVFRKLGIKGWRRNQRLLGNPDFVFRAQRLCVFVDGCFWHGCPKCYRRPASNEEYWDAKAQRNKARDREVNRVLRAHGWRVLRIWEHQLRENGRPNLKRRFRKYGLQR